MLFICIKRPPKGTPSKVLEDHFNSIDLKSLTCVEFCSAFLKGLLGTIGNPSLSVLFHLALNVHSPTCLSKTNFRLGGLKLQRN